MKTYYFENKFSGNRYRHYIELDYELTTEECYRLEELLNAFPHNENQDWHYFNDWPNRFLLLDFKDFPKKLLTIAANAYSDTQSILATAAEYGDARIVQKLLDLGADPNAPDHGPDPEIYSYNKLPLHWAIANRLAVQDKTSYEAAQVVKCLLDNGARIDIPCYEEPLAYAQKRGYKAAAYLITNTRTKAFCFSDEMEKINQRLLAFRKEMDKEIEEIKELRAGGIFDPIFSIKDLIINIEYLFYINSIQRNHPPFLFYGKVDGKFDFSLFGDFKWYEYCVEPLAQDEPNISREDVREMISLMYGYDDTPGFTHSVLSLLQNKLIALYGQKVFESIMQLPHRNKPVLYDKKGYFKSAQLEFLDIVDYLEEYHLLDEFFHPLLNHPKLFNDYITLIVVLCEESLFTREVFSRFVREDIFADPTLLSDIAFLLMTSKKELRQKKIDFILGIETLTQEHMEQLEAINAKNIILDKEVSTSVQSQTAEINDLDTKSLRENAYALLPQIGLFSPLDASNNGNPLTPLQSSLLKGFIGYS